MKKISAAKSSVFSLIMLIAMSAFGIGELLFSLIGANTILGWLKNAHIAYYVNATAVSSGITKLVIDKSFQSLFTTGYIRVMAMYIFVLCIPVIYALFNVYLISKNGEGKRPFSSATSTALKSITFSFVAEFFLASVLFIILKLIMKVLPFYFMYAMIAVCVFSLVIIIVTISFNSLIERMNDLRSEHIRKKRQGNVNLADNYEEKKDSENEFEMPPAPQADISNSASISKKHSINEENSLEKNKGNKKAERNFKSDFDDILSDD